MQPPVILAMNEELAAVYTWEEIVAAWKQIHPVTGTDGMQALFYKKLWYVISDDVLDYVLDILNNNFPLARLITLILFWSRKRKIASLQKIIGP